jgi:hypothetical protein
LAARALEASPAWNAITVTSTALSLRHRTDRTARRKLSLDRADDVRSDAANLTITRYGHEPLADGRSPHHLCRQADSRQS